MRFAVSHKRIAEFLACLLGAFSPGLVMGQAGPVLPPQGPQVINELTTLVVTNTAVETNVPPGQQFGTVVVTNRLTFAYADRNALLADGWNFMATTSGTNRNTEVTNSANGLLIDYNQNGHPGSISIPCDRGDMWQINDVGDSPAGGPVVPNGTNPPAYNTRNMLIRALSPNWTNIDLTFTFYADTLTQQAGIALYQDDDNFLLTSLGFSNIRIPSRRGLYHGGHAQGVLRLGYGGRLPLSAFLNFSPHSHPYDWYATGGATHVLRWSRPDLNTGLVVAYWSPWADLNPWSDIGDIYTLSSTPQPPQLVNPRIAIWTGCAAPATPGAASMVLSKLEVISIEPAVSLAYRLIIAPAGASIDTHGVISWTPAQGQFPSTNVFATVVTDNSLPPVSATNSFTVVVQDINTAPVLPPQPNRTVSILNTLAVTNTAAEADPNSLWLNYQLAAAPPGATIDANGIISWTPGTDQQYTTNLFVTVVTDFDPQALNAQSLSATNSFTVVVLPPPWPVLPNQPDFTVRQSDTLTVTNTAVDGALTVNQIGTNTIAFNYANRAALLADGWSFYATNAGAPRNTEILTGAGAVDYNQALHPGVLNIPCDQGDLYGTAYNNTQNTLFRSLPPDWQSVRLALTFAPIAANYQQAHLGLYQDDDNYLQMGVAYNTWDTTYGPQRFTIDLEIGGAAATPAEAQTTSTSFYFRLDRNPVNFTVTNSFSFDGVTWMVLGVTNLPFANPRLMIWTGGCDPANPANFDLAVMSLQRLDIVAGAQAPAVLSYSLVNPPPGATIDANGIITWKPNSAGAHTITTLAFDNGVPPLSATNSFTVTVNPWESPTISASSYSGASSR